MSKKKKKYKRMVWVGYSSRGIVESGTAYEITDKSGGMIEFIGENGPDSAHKNCFVTVGRYESARFLLNDKWLPPLRVKK